MYLSFQVGLYTLLVKGVCFSAGLCAQWGGEVGGGGAAVAQLGIKGGDEIKWAGGQLRVWLDLWLSFYEEKFSSSKYPKKSL